jgi:hypothetical protein
MWPYDSCRLLKLRAIEVGRIEGAALPNERRVSLFLLAKWTAPVRAIRDALGRRRAQSRA